MSEAAIIVNARSDVHTQKSCGLSVIVPLRAAGSNDALIDRLSHIQLDTELPSQVSVLVVDDGSPRDASKQISKLCKQLGYRYIRIPSEDSVFSVGRCRNLGAQVASSEFIFFQDVDLMPWPGFYRKLMHEVRTRQLQSDAARFIMVGVSYLTERASRTYLSTEPELLYPNFLHLTLFRENEAIEKFSTGTSACVYNRMFYLAIGGNRAEYEGWGYEDIEFNCRVMRFRPPVALPNDWAIDRGTFDNQMSFDGWKSLYRLHGDLSLAKGLLLFHRWHKVDRNSDYLERTNHNRKLFEQQIRFVDKKHLYPAPLPDEGSGTTWVVSLNTFTMNRFVAPRWGKIVFSDKLAFSSEDDITRFVNQNRIDRVVFHNPYATEKTKAIFDHVRRVKLHYYVAERGALSGSFFYDPSGFLADSASYDPALWNKELMPAQKIAVRKAMLKEQLGQVPLERQPERISRERLIARLKLSGLKPVVFIPLQRPSDTATRFFANGEMTYQRYLDEIKRLVSLGSAQYDFVVKKHPLEDEVPGLGGIEAGETNVFDLLALSVAVVTFNSGVGCVAQCFMKPVIHFGRAFYGHAGIAAGAQCAEDALALLNRQWQPDRKLVERFLHYLFFTFYSFGTFESREVATKGGRITATADILPQVLRLDGTPLIQFNPGLYDDVTRSRMMERYGPQRLARPAKQEEPAANNIAFRLLPHAGSLFHTKCVSDRRPVMPYEPVVPGICCGQSPREASEQAFSIAQGDPAAFGNLGRNSSFTAIFSRQGHVDRWAAIEFDMCWDVLLNYSRITLGIAWRGSGGMTIGTGLFIPYTPSSTMSQWECAEVTPRPGHFRRSFDIPNFKTTEVNWNETVKLIFELPKRKMDLEIASLEITGIRV